MNGQSSAGSAINASGESDQQSSGGEDPLNRGQDQGDLVGLTASQGQVLKEPVDPTASQGQDSKGLVGPPASTSKGSDLANLGDPAALSQGRQDPDHLVLPSLLQSSSENESQESSVDDQGFPKGLPRSFQSLFRQEQKEKEQNQEDMDISEDESCLETGPPLNKPPFRGRMQRPEGVIKYQMGDDAPGIIAQLHEAAQTIVTVHRSIVSSTWTEVRETMLKCRHNSASKINGIWALGASEFNLVSAPNFLPTGRMEIALRNLASFIGFFRIYYGYTKNLEKELDIDVQEAIWDEDIKAQIVRRAEGNVDDKETDVQRLQTQIEELEENINRKNRDLETITQMYRSERDDTDMMVATIKKDYENLMSELEADKKKLKERLLVQEKNYENEKRSLQKKMDNEINKLRREMKEEIEEIMKKDEQERQEIIRREEILRKEEEDEARAKLETEVEIVRKEAKKAIRDVYKEAMEKIEEKEKIEKELLAQIKHEKNRGRILENHIQDINRRHEQEKEKNEDSQEEASAFVMNHEIGQIIDDAEEQISTYRDKVYYLQDDLEKKDQEIDRLKLEMLKRKKEQDENAKAQFERRNKDKSDAEVKGENQNRRKRVPKGGERTQEAYSFPQMDGNDSPPEIEEIPQMRRERSSSFSTGRTYEDLSPTKGLSGETGSLSINIPSGTPRKYSLLRTSTQQDLSQMKGLLQNPRFAPFKPDQTQTPLPMGAVNVQPSPTISNSSQVTLPHDHYSRFPKPFNVPPIYDAASAADLQKMASYNPLKNEIAEYPRWRSWYLYAVHQTPLPVDLKIDVLLRCIEKNPAMDIDRQGSVVSFEGYKALLDKIERLYGDQRNLLSSFVKKMQDAKTAYVNDWESVNNLSSLLHAYENRRIAEGSSGEPEAVFEIVYGKLDEQLRSKLLEAVENSPQESRLVVANRFLDKRARTLEVTRFFTREEKEPKEKKVRFQNHNVKSTKESKVHLGLGEPEKSAISQQDLQNALAFLTEKQANNGFDQGHNIHKGPLKYVPGLRAAPEPQGHQAHLGQDYNRRRRPMFCPQCQGDHPVSRCPEYINLPNNEERVRLAYYFNLCINCLGSGHRADRCRSTRSCGNCGMRHHTTLCGGFESEDPNGKLPPKKYVAKDPNDNNDGGPAASGTGSREGTDSTGKTQGAALNTIVVAGAKPEINNPEQYPRRNDSDSSENDFGDPWFVSTRTVTIKVRRQEGGAVWHINALMDDGAAQSLISNHLADRLFHGIRSAVPTRLELEGFGGIPYSENAYLLPFSVCDQFKDTWYNMHAITMRNLVGDMIPTPWNAFKHRFDHMELIPFSDPAPGKIDLIIGNDYGFLCASQQEILCEHPHTRPQQPIARLTRLGWTATGPTGDFFEHKDVTLYGKGPRVVLELNNYLMKRIQDHKRESGYCIQAMKELSLRQDNHSFFVRKEADLYPPLEPRDGYGDTIVPEETPGVDCISLRCIALNITGPDGTVKKINALLDDGSNRTMIESQLARELGLEVAEDIQLSLKGVGGISTSETSQIVKCEISSCSNAFQATIFAATAKAPTGTLYPVDWTRLRHYWNHLRRDYINLTPFADGPVRMLIGSDYPLLMMSEKETAVHCGRIAPVARLTPLGWTIIGPLLPAREHRDVRAARLVKEAESSGFLSAYQALSRRSKVMVIRNQPSTKEVERLLKRTLQIQHLPGDEEVEQTRSQEDMDALRILEESRSHDGERYAFSVLWKPGYPRLLPCNRYLAESRLRNLEKSQRFQDPVLRKAYLDQLEEWKNRGYFVEVENDPENDGGYYLPHFMVVREDKTTTKVRPVLDGAAKYSGTCLNDGVYVGPKNIGEVFSVLLRMRRFQVAFMGDVEAMFLQIANKPGDGQFQRILFRRDPKDPLQVWEPTRHIFGNAGSPCVAIHCIKTHAKDLEGLYPRAAEAVIESSIVDDVLDSVKTAEEAIQVIKDLITLFQECGMKIRKFMSNSKEVLESLDESMRAKNIDIEINDLNSSSNLTPIVKSLGVVWLVDDDVFTFVAPSDLEEKYDPWTKRACLSVSHQIYDPLGLIEPVILMAKVFMKLLWETSIEWSDKIPEETLPEWMRWIASLSELTKIRIPRCLIPDEEENVEIHTFVDASTYAYGAVSYLVSGPEGSRQSRLIASQSRVVGKDGMSIPRLELCAARLGVLLALKIKKALDRDYKLFYWSDSTNVLYWLKNRDKKRKMFIANRVRDVLTYSKEEEWNWVPTEQNPADLVSRGCMPAHLAESCWFQGPHWLVTGEWPEMPIKLTPTPDIEVENAIERPLRLKGKDQAVETFLAREASPEEIELEKYINQEIEGVFEEKAQVLLNRVVELDLREVSGLAKMAIPPEEILTKVKTLLYSTTKKRWYRQTIEKSNLLNVFDLEYHSELGRAIWYHTIPFHWYMQMAVKKPFLPFPRDARVTYAECLHRLVRLSQAKSYPDEIMMIQGGNALPKKSKLTPLLPVLEEKTGTMRVSGRLVRYSQKKIPPRILDGKEHLAYLVVLYTHVKELSHEGGVNHLISMVRETFWIIGLRVLAKKILRNCVFCKRQAALRSRQQMAPLPEFRIPQPELTHPFQTTAIDCAGPFFLSNEKKVWIVLFTCAEYRAIHLEMLEHMSTESFILAFRRFVGTRGVPKRIVSDNGTNFLGASNAFMQMRENIRCQKIRAVFPLIEWQFTTPYTPHAGGVFERMVRSVKIAMNKKIGFHVLPSEEMFKTILVEVAGLLNSRPLTFDGDDISDLKPITPNHFLGVGKNPDVALDSVDHTKVKYKKLKNTLQEFKDQFVRELVPLMQALPRDWTKEQDNIQVGEVVTLIEANHVGAWPLAQVTQVHTSQDGLVRSVDLRVAIPKDVDPSLVEESRDEAKIRWSAVKCGRTCKFVNRIYHRDIRRIVRLGIKAPEAKGIRQQPGEDEIERRQDEKTTFLASLDLKKLINFDNEQLRVMYGEQDEELDLKLIRGMPARQGEKDWKQEEGWSFSAMAAQKATERLGQGIYQSHFSQVDPINFGRIKDLFCYRVELVFHDTHLQKDHGHIHFFHQSEKKSTFNSELEKADEVRFLKCWKNPNSSTWNFVEKKEKDFETNSEISLDSKFNASRRVRIKKNQGNQNSKTMSRETRSQKRRASEQEEASPSKRGPSIITLEDVPHHIPFPKDKTRYPPKTGALAQQLNSALEQWKEKSTIERRTSGLHELEVVGAYKEGYLMLPAGVMKMLSESKKTRDKYAPVPPKDQIPKTWRDTKSLKLRPPTRGSMAGKSVKEVLKARARICMPAIRIDGQADLPYVAITSTAQWYKERDYILRAAEYFGYIHIDFESFHPSVLKHKDCSKNLPDNRFILMGIGRPWAYIIDCISVDLFRHGVPQEFYDALNEKQIYLYGSGLAEDFRNAQTPIPVHLWADTQVVFKQFLDDNYQDKKEYPPGMGLGNVCRYFYDINHKPDKILSFTFNGWRHPDSYGKNRSEPDPAEYKFGGELYKWDITQHSAPIIFGYHYTDLMMANKVLLEAAYAAAEDEDTTEREAIRRILAQAKCVDPKGVVEDIYASQFEAARRMRDSESDHPTSRNMIPSTDDTIPWHLQHDESILKTQPEPNPESTQSVTETEPTGPGVEGEVSGQGQEQMETEQQEQQTQESVSKQESQSAREKITKFFVEQINQQRAEKGLPPLTAEEYEAKKAYRDEKAKHQIEKELQKKERVRKEKELEKRRQDAMRQLEEEEKRVREEHEQRLREIRERQKATEAEIQRVTQEMKEKDEEEKARKEQQLQAAHERMTSRIFQEEAKKRKTSKSSGSSHGSSHSRQSTHETERASQSRSQARPQDTKTDEDQEALERGRQRAIKELEKEMAKSKQATQAREQQRPSIPVSIPISTTSQSSSETEYRPPTYEGLTQEQIKELKKNEEVREQMIKQAQATAYAPPPSFRIRSKDETPDISDSEVAKMTVTPDLPELVLQDRDLEQELEQMETTPQPSPTEKSKPKIKSPPKKRPYPDPEETELSLREYQTLKDDKPVPKDQQPDDIDREAEQQAARTGQHVTEDPNLPPYLVWKNSCTSEQNPANESFTLPPEFCMRCGMRTGSTCGCPNVLCEYPACYDTTPHNIKFCSQLAARCAECHLRGHTARYCQDFSMKQWIFVYEQHQAQNIWTCDPDKNIAVSVFPIPRTIKGEVLRRWSLATKRSAFFLRAPRRAFIWSVSYLNTTLSDATEDMREDPEYMDQYEAIDQAITEYARLSGQVTKAYTEQTRVNQFMDNSLNKAKSGLFKCPPYWDSKRFKRWLSRFIYALYCTGMPKFSLFHTDITTLLREIGKEGIHPKRGARLPEICPRTFSLLFVSATISEQAVAQAKKTTVFSSPPDVKSVHPEQGEGEEEEQVEITWMDDLEPGQVEENEPRAAPEKIYVEVWRRLREEDPEQRAREEALEPRKKKMRKSK